MGLLVRHAPAARTSCSPGLKLDSGVRATDERHEVAAHSDEEAFSAWRTGLLPLGGELNS